MKEPRLIIPRSIDRTKTILDFAPCEFEVYIPLPNTPDKGIYVNRSDFVKLLRANKHNLAAVQYLADMME